MVISAGVITVNIVHTDNTKVSHSLGRRVVFLRIVHISCRVLSSAHNVLNPDFSPHKQASHLERDKCASVTRLKV